MSPSYNMACASSAKLLCRRDRSGRRLHDRASHLACRRLRQDRRDVRRREDRASGPCRTASRCARAGLNLYVRRAASLLRATQSLSDAARSRVVVDPARATYHTHRSRRQPLARDLPLQEFSDIKAQVLVTGNLAPCTVCRKPTAFHGNSSCCGMCRAVPDKQTLASDFFGSLYRKS